MAPATLRRPGRRPRGSCRVAGRSSTGSGTGSLGAPTRSHQTSWSRASPAKRRSVTRSPPPASRACASKARYRRNASRKARSLDAAASSNTTASSRLHADRWRWVSRRMIATARSPRATSAALASVCSARAGCVTPALASVRMTTRCRATGASTNVQSAPRDGMPSSRSASSARKRRSKVTRSSSRLTIGVAVSSSSRRPRSQGASVVTRRVAAFAQTMRLVDDHQLRVDRRQSTARESFMRPPVDRDPAAGSRRAPLSFEDGRADHDGRPSLHLRDRERDPRLAGTDRLRQDGAVPLCQRGAGALKGRMLLRQQERRHDRIRRGRARGLPPRAFDLAASRCARRDRRHRQRPGELRERLSDDAWPAGRGRCGHGD